MYPGGGVSVMGKVALSGTTLAKSSMGGRSAGSRGISLLFLKFVGTCTGGRIGWSIFV